MKTDLVYILGSGSSWNNNEIRFSLRSVEKNLKEVGNVYVIGERPDFLSEEIIHIAYPDLLVQNADGNMARKILRVCKEPGLSENFLFMNDDFIINHKITAGKIPWMHKGNMKNRDEAFWKAEFYRKRLRRTFDILRDKGYPTMQYDYHAPMLMNKFKFPECMKNFDFETDIGYTFRSLYGNFWKLPAKHLVTQKKTIYKFYNLTQLQKGLKKCTFVGYNDKGLNDSLKVWMWNKFPEISKYEKSDTDDLVINIFQWMQAGKDYRQGVELFKRYVKNRNLIKLFDNSYSPQLHEKLTYKLNLRLMYI